MLSAPLFLLAISNTVLLLLVALPFVYARQLRHAGLKAAFLPSISTACASLSGLLGLVALGAGSRGAAVIGGVLGVAALALLDLQVLLLVWPSGANGESGRTSVARVAPAALAGVLLFIAITLDVGLLCLDSPSQSTLLALAIARGVVHIVFAFSSVALIAVASNLQVQSAVSSITAPKRDLEARLQVEPYYVWQQRVAGLPQPQEPSLPWTSFCRTFEAGLIVVQTASVLLDVLSLAFPLHPNYTPSASLANLHPPPTFFGTTTSPAGYVVLSILVALRWLWLFKISADHSGHPPHAIGSKTSLTPHRQHSGTPTPSIVPLTHESTFSLPGFLREDADTVYRPSTNLSRNVSPTSTRGSGTLSRQTSLWSMTAGHEDATSPTTIDSSTALSPTSASARRGARRQLSISSLLSIGRSTIVGTAERRGKGGEEGGEHVEMQEQYYHTETCPAPHGSDSGEGRGSDGGGEEEDLMVSRASTPLPRRASPSFHRSHHSLPGQFSALPTSAPPSSPSHRRSSSSNAAAFLDRSRSALSFGPLLGEQSSESTSPPSPTKTRVIPPSPSRTPSASLRTQPKHHHDSTASSVVSAYYSLPRYPTPTPTSTAANDHLVLPKKQSRPSLVARASFNGSLGAASPRASVKSDDSPTRSRSGSAGSLLRTLKRESAAPSVVSTVGEWEIEPNEEVEDPFARVTPTRTASSRGKSLEALGDAEAGTGVIEEEGSFEDEMDGGETGSIIDYGSEVSVYEDGEEGEGEEEVVERVLTPVPDTPRDSLDAVVTRQPHPPSVSRNTLTRTRSSSNASSIFVEHFDDDLAAPPQVRKSISYGTLAPANDVDQIRMASPTVPPPSIVIKRSYGSLPRVQRSATLPNVLVEPVKFSVNPTAPLHLTKTRARPSIFPLVSPPPSLPESANHSLTNPLPVTASTSIFSSASFPLRRLRLRGSSTPVIPAGGGGIRKSAASDLSFACRGAVWTPSEPTSPQSAGGGDGRVGLPSFGTRLEMAAEKTVIGVEEKVEEAPESSSLPVPTIDVDNPDAPPEDKKGRSAWWRSLPGSRPSTQYRRRSGSVPFTRSSSPVSFRLSSMEHSNSPSSSASPTSSAHYRHSNLHLQLPSSTLLRLSQYQLDTPPAVSPLSTSFVHRSFTSSVATRRLSAGDNRPSNDESIGSSSIPRSADATNHPQPSAATSRRSFSTAPDGEGGEGGGSSVENHLAELEE